jgi:hypothetical protein
VLISLALHACLALLLYLRPPPPPPREKPATMEWVIVEVPPAPPPKVVPPVPVPPPEPPKPELAKKKPKKDVEPIAEAQPEEVQPAPAPAPAPMAADLPAAPSKPINLFPVPSLAPSTEVAEAPHGHTVRPTDPEFRPEVIRAEEEHRVNERVTAFAQDELAEARAQGGLPHPYFSGVREAAKKGLAKRAKEQGIKATTTQMMTQIGKRYADSASSYAKSGNPDLGPPGINPRPSERLNERFGNIPETMALRALAQATETQDELSHGKPLITLTLELRQFRDGSPLTAVVLKASSDPKFDAFVLEAWPKSIAEAGAPPDDAFHGPVLRSIWAVEGWLGMPKKLEEAFSYVPVPGMMGIGVDKVLPALTAEGYHYEFQARLLRVYQ